ncbi:MAG: tetratricopeptide repeat protein, partial [Burkholderiales bacterium]|nr:tetratricopeptide repeat protein [Burkholderiales bacterium]
MQRLIERLASLLRGAGARAAGARAEAERGVALAWHAGDLQRAIALGARALARWPESADLHFMSGACLLEAGRPDEALAALREARRLARAYPLELLCELHLALALVRAGRERYELQPVDTTRTGALTSIVICSAEDARFERAAVDFRAHFAAVPHEIVRIADARSLAEGYNRGMRRARGERLVFTHDDARIVTPDFAQRLDRHFAEADLIGIAGTRRLSGAA